MKADGEFFMNLNQKRIKEMADCLWETKRDLVISELDLEVVSTQEKELEALRKEISDLKKGAKGPKEEAEVLKLKHAISVKENAIADLKAKIAEAARNTKEEVKTLKKENQIRKKESEKLMREIAELNEVMADAVPSVNEVEDLKKEILLQKAESEKLMQEITNRETAIAELKTDLADYFRRGNDEKALRREIALLRDEVVRLKAAEENLSRAEDLNRTLKADIDNLRDLNAGMETIIAGNSRDSLHANEKSFNDLLQREARVTEMERELQGRMAVAEHLINQYAKLVTGKTELENMTVPQSVKSPGGVFHTGVDEIYSEQFGAEKYDVIISVDGRFLEVRENAGGKAICRGGKLFLSELERFVPFKGKRELKTVIKDGIFTIQMREVSA